MLTGEELKDIYNENYKKSKDNWSETNLKQTDRIASRIDSFICNDKMKHCSFLDVGSAKGHQAESFRKIGYKAYGLDYSDVAVNKAKELFPSNTFFVMDGFNPKFEIKFDVILMKGFSGTNTHDLEFVKTLCTKYIDYLSPKGYFILSFSSNYSGKEKINETVNWSHEEIKKIQNIKGAKFISVENFSYSFFRKIIRKALNLISKKKKKNIFYIIYQRDKS